MPCLSQTHSNTSFTVNVSGAVIGGSARSPGTPGGERRLLISVLSIFAREFCFEVFPAGLGLLVNARCGDDFARCIPSLSIVAAIVQRMNTFRSECHRFATLRDHLQSFFHLSPRALPASRPRPPALSPRSRRGRRACP